MLRRQSLLIRFSNSSERWSKQKWFRAKYNHESAIREALHSPQPFSILRGDPRNRTETTSLSQHPKWPIEAEQQFIAGRACRSYQSMEAQQTLIRRRSCLLFYDQKFNLCLAIDSQDAFNRFLSITSDCELVVFCAG